MLGRFQKNDLIAVDGKSLRGSLDRANTKAAVHRVSAWCNANQMVLGQVASRIAVNRESLRGAEGRVS